MNVLMLNATYEPITIVNFKRAVCLLLEEKAEVVDESPHVIRSPSIVMKIPSVIRLLKYVKIPYRTTMAMTKRGILRRDRHMCAYCGKRGATIDHIMPRSKGGEHTWTNVVTACARCNQAKGDRTLDQLGWKLLYRPEAPRSKAWYSIGLIGNKDWEEYLVDS